MIIFPYNPTLHLLSHFDGFYFIAPLRLCKLKSERAGVMIQGYQYLNRLANVFPWWFFTLQNNYSLICFSGFLYIPFWEYHLAFVYHFFSHSKLFVKSCTDGLLYKVSVPKNVSFGLVRTIVHLFSK